MSVAQNNIVRQVAPKSVFESALPVLSTAVTYNQGDLLYFNNSTNLIGPLAASGSATGCLGVAIQTIVNGVASNPYTSAVDASVGISDVGGPVYGVVAFFTLKTGDAFNPGSKVYPTGDPQTVTVTDPGNALYIGIFQGRAVASAAAGQVGDVLVGNRYGLASGAINF